jgi:hypothetical protein
MSSQTVLERKLAPPTASATNARPAPLKRTRAPKDEPSGKSHVGLGLILGCLGSLIALNLAGLPYFLLSTVERVRSPLHPWFRPSGFIGQTAGIASFALFMFLWLYPLQKKFRRLAFGGSRAMWLNAHVVAGLCVPFLATLHAAWRFTGLIGLGYGAMMVAWLSGIVGRYVYVRIPRSRTGVELTREELESRRRAVLQQIVDATGIDGELLEHALLSGSSPTISPDANVLKAIAVMIGDDVRRWRAAGQLRWDWHGATAAEQQSDKAARARLHALLRNEIALMQQARMLDVTHRLLRYWHVAHKPMAIAALGAVVLHVGTAIALGVTWFH